MKTLFVACAALLLLAAVVAAEEEINDLEYAATDALHNEGYVTRGVIRRHSRFTRQHDAENADELREMLEKVEGNLSSMSDEEKEEMEHILGNEEEQLEDNEHEQEENEEEDGEHREIKHEGQESHSIEEALRHMAERKHFRHARHTDGKEEKSLKHLLRHDDQEKLSAADQQSVDRLFRRDFGQVEEDKQFDSVSRRTLNAIKRKGQEKNSWGRFLKKEEANDEQREAKNAMRRLERGVRRQYQNKNYFRREIHDLGDVFHKMASRVARSQSRNARKMGRSFRRLSHGDKEDKEFSKLGKSIRRQEEQKKETGSMDNLFKDVAKGFEKDRSREEAQKDQVEKTLEKSEEQTQQREQFHALKETQKHEAKKLEKAAEGKGIVKEIKKDGREEELKSKFDELHKLLANIAVRTNSNQLGDRLTSATNDWIGSSGVASSSGSGSLSTVRSIGPIVRRAIRQAIHEHFGTLRAVRASNAPGSNLPRVHFIYPPYQAAYQYPPPEQFPQWKSSYSSEAGMGDLIHDAIRHALAYRSWLAAKNAYDSGVINYNGAGPAPVNATSPSTSSTTHAEAIEQAVLRAILDHRSGAPSNNTNGKVLPPPNQNVVPPPTTDAPTVAPTNNNATQNATALGAIIRNAVQNAILDHSAARDGKPAPAHAPLVIPNNNNNNADGLNNAPTSPPVAGAAFASRPNNIVGATAGNPMAASGPTGSGSIGAAESLLPRESTDAKFQISSYGSELQENKQFLQQGFRKCNVPLKMQVLITAMAMLETNHMSVQERDKSKDNRKDGSANVSPFNLSVDMVKRLGFANPAALNQQSRTPDAVCLIKKAFDSWGVSSTLDYVRGGYTAWKDHKSYGAPEYRTTIATIAHVIDQDPSLMTDDRRVEVFLGHV